MSDLKSFLTDDSIFFAPNLENGHPLGIILDRGLEQYGVPKPEAGVPEVLWGPGRYRLERSKVFVTLPPEQQQEVLKRISRWNLSLSYFIEKSGHNYGAKMVLLSERIEEKSLYCLFSAEEAIHLRLFRNFMSHTPDPATDWHPMLNPLARVIRDGSKEACVLLIQVLLEGFGMGHYRSLMEDCLYPGLVQAFQRILRDEARHHGAGLVLAKESRLQADERDECFEFTREFVNALQSAHWVLRAVEEVRGPLSIDEQNRHFEAVGHREILEQRLISLREMLSKAGREQLVSRLERDGVFKIKGPGL
jgi:hypothetical protein